ncbi:MAG: tyrosinase family protein [Methylobacter sp.]|jgi:hypothetical protein
MARRTDIYTWGDQPKRQRLADAIKAYAQPAITDQHANVASHLSGSYFFHWHREYIAGLERFLRQQQNPLLKETDLLPKWNPVDKKTDRAAIPAPEFLVPNTGSKAIHQPAPPIPSNFFAPFQGQNLAQWDNLDALGFAVAWGPHFEVHRRVGGVMADVPHAAEAPIFWLYHAFIDEIWHDWESLPGRTLVRVPWVIGLTQSEAEATIRANNLAVGAVTEAPHPHTPRMYDIRWRNGVPKTYLKGHEHRVTAQFPLANTQVIQNAEVKLWTA